MSREIRPDYETQYLFPPSLEQWVGADHPVRYVREFVDALDLSALGLTSEQESRRNDPNGRPHYAVDLLLKVWLYGYMYGIRSSRALERGCRDTLPLVWLAGTHVPDHNTLWRFWSRYREVIRQVFLQSVRVASEAKLVGMVMQALDGTKIKSAAAKRSAWHRADLEKLLAHVETNIARLEEEIGQAGEEGGAEDRLPETLKSREELRNRIHESLAALSKADREHMQPQDPDARMMASHGRTEFAYNAQAMVDEQIGIVVAADVTDEANDSAQLAPMLEQTQQNTGRFATTTVADSGYHTAEGLSAAAAMGADVVVAVKQKAHQVGPYHTMRFTYDQQSDSVRCPQQQTLAREGTRRHKDKPYPVNTYRCHAAKTCPVATECSRDRKGRLIEISPHHEAVLRNREHPNARALLRQRQMIVERAFAEIKEVLRMRRWTVRGREKVRDQWSMICAAFNLRRMLAARAI
ncbi:MAG TPA: IS1182 family transposase [Thermoanaerobaculia bacterium]|nr:IS1182 family transposase [Thermoanaerobaculia bacterium]